MTRIDQNFTFETPTTTSFVSLTNVFSKIGFFSFFNKILTRSLDPPWPSLCDNDSVNNEIKQVYMISNNDESSIKFFVLNIKRKIKKSFKMASKINKKVLTRNFYHPGWFISDLVMD